MLGVQSRSQRLTVGSGSARLTLTLTSRRVDKPETGKLLTLPAGGHVATLELVLPSSGARQPPACRGEGTPGRLQSSRAQERADLGSRAGAQLTGCVALGGRAAPPTACQPAVDRRGPVASGVAFYK